MTFSVLGHLQTFLILALALAVVTDRWYKKALAVSKSPHGPNVALNICPCVFKGGSNVRYLQCIMNSVHESHQKLKSHCGATKCNYKTHCAASYVLSVLFQHFGTQKQQLQDRKSKSWSFLIFTLCCLSLKRSRLTKTQSSVLFLGRNENFIIHYKI